MPFRLPSLGIRRALYRRFRRAVDGAVDPNTVLRKLHVPLSSRTGATLRFPEVSPRAVGGEHGGFPLPPEELTLSWNASETEYVESGIAHAARIRELVASQGRKIDDLGQVMDWGCAAGRVLRHFAPEARSAEFWGVDAHQPCIHWARTHLAPPFRFLGSTQYPYLPFSDAHFDLVYGLSVMTHLEHFRDLWLMELRRLLRPGGLLILTVHDEHTVRHLIENGPRGALGLPDDLSPVLDHEVSVVEGEDWTTTFTFFRGDYLEREWGRFFEVVEIRPHAIGIQSAVVMRRP